LVFNSAFDAALIPYDARYENRQCFSTAFQEHLQTLAADLIARHRLRGKNVLEVGCGKGDFLKLLCRRAPARGTGYDTAYEGSCGRTRAGVRFYRQYVSASDISSRFDAVICRHVIEHVADIGGFLKELHAIAIACGDPVTILETPAFEWTADNLCFWDIFYEHCNYFTRPCLAWLCEQAGFTVTDQRLAFGGQYQLLELKARPKHSALSPRMPNIPLSLTFFARRAEARLVGLEKRLQAAGVERGWAVWGAAAKGVALINRLKKIQPRFVIDSNPAKQGCVICGACVPVIAPSDPRIRSLALVLIVNPNYEAEMTSTLRKSGFANTIQVL
jgi:ubiquinone/menaquinone biosynthesis C-methylase UbiE